MSQYSKKVFSKLAVILLIISMLIPQAVTLWPTKAE